MGRLTAAVVIAAALLAGCGGSGSSSSGTLVDLMKRPGPDVSVTPGASEFVPGSVRYPFLVIRNDARPVERGAASVWLAAGRDEKPFTRATARLEPIGVPGRSAPAFGDVSRIYVAHLRVPRPGRYWLSPSRTARRSRRSAPWTSSPVRRARLWVPSLHGRRRRLSPPRARQCSRPGGPRTSGSCATPWPGRLPPTARSSPPSPRRSSAPAGPAGPWSTSSPPCASASLRAPVRFIHVEVYRGNDPTKGYNRWMREWGLQSEPWTFVVGPTGA